MSASPAAEKLPGICPVYAKQDIDVMSEAAFIIVLSILAYTWLGYPLLLALAAASRRPGHGIVAEQKDVKPAVSVLVTVRNEAEVIRQRVANILDGDYPGELLEVMVASDGSIDETERIVKELAAADPRIRLLRTGGGGKSHAQNLAIARAGGEIVILTDAETAFAKNTISRLACRFADGTVGCVSGRLVMGKGKNGIAESQGLYWRYEMLLRSLESRAGTLHTASGLAMAFRRELFQPFEAVYGDDCIIPLNIIARGYRVVHENSAVAYDEMPHGIRSELNARIRMTLRNITCTLSKHQLINPFRHPLFSVSIVSHKLLRWFTPYSLILLLAANLPLLGRGWFFTAAFTLQLIAYLAALIGLAGEKIGRRVPLASPAFSFLLANVGFFLGVLYAMMGRRITAYREAAPAPADE